VKQELISSGDTADPPVSLRQKGAIVLVTKVSLKDEIKDLLEKKEFDRLVELAAREKNTIRYLNRFLYSEDDLLHWRAAEAYGLIAKDPSILSTERVRTIIERLFVALEDQSGGNGWGSIEAIGAMIAARPVDLKGFIPKMFVSIQDARLWVGLLWAVHKIGERRPDLFRDFMVNVIGLLHNPRRTTRGHAVWALSVVGDNTEIKVLDDALVFDVKEALQALLKDNNPVRLYIDGDFQERRISDLAKEALAALEGGKASAGKPGKYRKPATSRYRLSR
jgi:hypothetical protein